MKAVLLMAALSVAGADSEASVDEAKSLYRAGSEAYRRGRYDVAIRAFEAAKQLAAAPPVIFSLAQAYRLQYFADNDPQKLGAALSNYKMYVGKVPKGGRRDHAIRHISTLEPIHAELTRTGDQLAEDTKDRDIARLIVSSRVEGATARVDDGDPVEIPAAFEVPPGPHEVRVEAPEHQAKTVTTVGVTGSAVALNVDLDEIPGRLTVASVDGAQVIVDDRPFGIAPLAATDISSGRHVMVVSATGREPYVSTIDVQRGQSIEVTADLELTTQRRTAYGMFVGAGVAVVGAGVALGFALDRESKALDLRRKSEATALTEDEALRHNELRNARDDFARVAGITAGVGVAAGLAGILLYVFDDPGGARGPRLSPVISPDGGGASFAMPW